MAQFTNIAIVYLSICFVVNDNHRFSLINFYTFLFSTILFISYILLLLLLINAISNSHHISMFTPSTSTPNAFCSIPTQLNSTQLNPISSILYFVHLSLHSISIYPCTSCLFILSSFILALHIHSLFIYPCTSYPFILALHIHLSLHSISISTYPCTPYPYPLILALHIHIHLSLHSISISIYPCTPYPYPYPFILALHIHIHLSLHSIYISIYPCTPYTLFVNDYLKD